MHVHPSTLQSTPSLTAYTHLYTNTKHTKKDPAKRIDSHALLAHPFIAPDVQRLLAAPDAGACRITYPTYLCLVRALVFVCVD